MRQTGDEKRAFQLHTLSGVLRFEQAGELSNDAFEFDANHYEGAVSRKFNGLYNSSYAHIRVTPEAFTIHSNPSGNRPNAPHIEWPGAVTFTR